MCATRQRNQRPRPCVRRGCYPFYRRNCYLLGHIGSRSRRHGPRDTLYVLVLEPHMPTMSSTSNQARSDREKMFMMRIWAPLICLAGSLSVFGVRWPGLVLAFPFILAALFLLSLAEMQALPEGFRYRRLLKWKPFRGADLLQVYSARSWLVGCVKLNRLVLPWGRLYFVLDGSFHENPFRQRESKLLRRLRASATGHEDPFPISGPAEPPTTLTLLGAGAAGTLISSLSVLLHAESPAINLGKTSFPRWALIPLSILHFLLSSWPWILFLIMVYLILLSIRRKSADAYILAFVVGLLIPALVFRGR